MSRQRRLWPNSPLGSHASSVTSTPPSTAPTFDSAQQNGVDGYRVPECTCSVASPSRRLKGGRPRMYGPAASPYPGGYSPAASRRCTMADNDKPKIPRGFATMSPERRREIAALGGAAVPSAKRGFSLDRDLAIEAGRKGGMSVPGEVRSFTRDPELARKAGRKGGIAAHRRGYQKSHKT